MFAGKKKTELDSTRSNLGGKKGWKTKRDRYGNAGKMMGSRSLRQCEEDGDETITRVMQKRVMERRAASLGQCTKIEKEMAMWWVSSRKWQKNA